jgi:hypothetical protein
MSAKIRKDSFIKNNQILDGVFLDINKLPSISVTLSDEQYTIEPAYDQRPDLLASALYNNSRLWWVFALRNPDVIKDPLRDFGAGTTIFLPSAGSISALGDQVSLLSNRNGGA